MNRFDIYFIGAAISVACASGGEDPASNEALGIASPAVELGTAMAPLMACENHISEHDHGIEIWRLCADDQSCFIDCPWIEALGEYHLGKQRCVLGKPAPAPFQCVPTNRRCDGSRAQACANDGTWQTERECGVCAGGECVMQCNPGAQRCSGLQSQTCSDLGVWVTQRTCPVQCTGAGRCTAPTPVEPCMRPGSNQMCP